MTVSLGQNEWQAVLAVLARAPYSEVAQLIQSIAQQLQPAQAETPRPSIREVAHASD